MLKTAIAFRHIAFEDLGFFAETLRREGYAIRYHDAGDEDGAVEAARHADLLVVLGGPMGVYEGDRFHWIAAEADVIRERIVEGRPVLGICLGSQLIAHALGAAVYPGGTKEIGFAPITLSQAGRYSPLAAVTPGQAVLHWHGDTFDLPDGATLLASTGAYAHQAFSIGRHVLALQFHLEAGAVIDRWLIGHATELRDAGTDIAALKADADEQAPRLAEVADAVLTAWLAGMRP